jgi:hypothetical protein
MGRPVDGIGGYMTVIRFALVDSPSSVNGRTGFGTIAPVA